MEMRCALSGERITRIPLADPAFLEKFKQPYAVIHRHDIHGVFLRACENNNLITLETKAGARAVGWFILSDLVSSGAPRLVSPPVGETVQTRRPELKREDFRSPEYKPSDWRSIYVNIIKLGPNDEWETKWDYWESFPTHTSVVVGDHIGDQTTGVSELEVK